MKFVRALCSFLCVLTVAISASVSVNAIDVEAITQNEATANMKKILPIIWIQPTYVTDENKIRTIFREGIDNAVKGKHLEVVNYDEADSLFQEYLMENDIYPDEDKVGNGFLPKKQYLKEMGEEANADYVLVINTKITNETEKIAWFGFTDKKFEVTTLFNVFVYSVAENKYILNERISVTQNAAGTSHADRAFMKCCKKFMEDKFNLSNVNFN